MDVKVGGGEILEGFFYYVKEFEFNFKDNRWRVNEGF